MEKRSVDLMVRNGTVITMNDDDGIFEDALLCVQGDTLCHVGPGDERDFHAKKTIDARGGMILPGLVNAHTHAAMSLLRGLADDLPLMEWLNRYIFPAERKMDADFVHVGTLLACAEMIMSGTTTFCDMYLFEEQVALAAKKAGMRCLVGEVLYDFPSPNYGTIENGFAYTRSLIEKWENDPIVSVAVEPHSLFTCSPELLSEANDIALKHKRPFIIHLAETLDEVEEVRKRYGKSPVEHLRSLGLLGPELIAHHCVHVGESDIRAMSEYDVKVVHNPESNMKLAAGIAPVSRMLSSGLTVGLGTDGCASNNNLDLFTEMDTAAKLQKVYMMDPTVMDARTVLRMATIEGAKVLGLADIIGSLEEGKKADVIVVDTDKPHLTPLYDPYSHIVYAARGNDVIYSIINGQVIMENRHLFSMDLEEIMTLAREKSAAVKRWVA